MLKNRQSLKPIDFEISKLCVVNMPAPTMIKPPMFDAVLGRHPMMSCIVQSSDAKEIISAKKFQDMAQIINPLLHVVNKNHVAAHHDTTQHFVDAFAMADKYIRVHPD